MRSRSLFWGFIAIALAGMAVSNLSLVASARTNLQRVILPLASALERSTSRSVGLFELWANINNLAAQNAELTKQNTQLKAQVETLAEFEKENASLRDQLNIPPAITKQGVVVARVIGYSPLNFLSTVTIDRGQKDGSRVGAPVLAGGFLAGLVSQVTDTTSVVRLTSAHNSLIPVILSKSRAKGLLSGGVRGLVVDDLPADAQIVKGESIVTAGLVDQIPIGIPVGELDEIISTKGEIFQVGRVKTPINFNRLEIVAVLKQ